MSKTVNTIRQALTLRPNELGLDYIINGWVHRIRRYRNHAFLDINDGTCSQPLQCVVPKSLLGSIGNHGSCVQICGKLVESKGSYQNVELKVEKISLLGDCDPLTYPFGSNFDMPGNYCREHPHLKPRVPLYRSLNRFRSELNAAISMIMRQMDFVHVQTPILTSNDSESSGDLFTVLRAKSTNSNLSMTGNLECGLADSTDLDIDEINSDDEMGDEMKKEKPTSRELRPEYFGKDVYLTCSAQLHLEMLAASLSRVYTISSAFRAENSNTRRHMAEFTMFEAEEAFCSQPEDLANRVETIFKFVMHYTANLSPLKSDLQLLLNHTNHSKIFEKMLSEKFERITYGEAIEILKNSKLNTSLGFPTIRYGDDIKRQHEKYLVQYCGYKPVFIFNFPKHLKAFYMKSCDCTLEDKANNRNQEEYTNRPHVLSFDLIGPVGGELCGGSIREDRLNILDENIVAMSKSIGQSEDMVRSRLNWYIDLRRYGSFPHGGFGIGIERMIQSITGVNNIKDVSMFPRWPRHCPL